MLQMKEGDIGLASLRQANGENKDRPVLLIKKMLKYDDWLVSGISSQVQQEIRDIDILIDKTHPDYNSSGLKSESIIRPGFLAVLPESEIKGIIGYISSSTYQSLISQVNKLF